MIILDTHIWVWWVHNEKSLPENYRECIKHAESEGLGLSAISCWEVAKLVEIKRLTLHCPIDAWMATALHYPGMTLLELTPQIAIESTRLPGEFHRDPADQMIVATARMYDCVLLTMDEKILNYPHVKLLR